MGVPDPDPAALRLLACPHCAGPLALAGDGAVGCPAGHRFDLARQGYLPLLGPRSRTDTGDSADMVAARAEFLGAGHYDRIARTVTAALTGAVDPGVSGAVVEVGAGTGFYAARLLDAMPDRIGLALDASRFAARRAARAHPRLTSVLADAWAPLPVLDGAAAVVLSVFAPRDAPQLARILASGGLLAVVVPEPDHLQQVRDLGLLTVDAGKADALAAGFAGLLEPVTRTACRYRVWLDPQGLGDLVRMGPAARHVDPADLGRRLAHRPDGAAVTVSVTVSVLRKP